MFITKKRFQYVILSIVIAFSFLFPAYGTENAPFSDVSPDDWFAPYIDVCVEEGLMAGTGDGRFSPGQYVTMAECILLTVRLDRLRKGGDGPLTPAPKEWGTVVITGEDGAVLFGTEDYHGYHSSGDQDVICLPPEAVRPLVGTGGKVSVNGTLSFEGQFVVNEDPQADWNWAGLALYGLTYREFEEVLDGYALAGTLAQTPEWLLDGLYYAQQEGLDLGYLDVLPYPATRLGFLTALEGVMDPRELEQINIVEVLPDVPADRYMTWTDHGRSGTNGNFGDFYRAGVLSGTDEYGAFRGDLPLTRAECAAMLARLLRPELRLRFTLTPWPWKTEYELVELGISAENWWNGGDVNWNFSSSVEHSLDQQLLRVSRREGSDIDYDQDGVFSIDGTWLVEPGLYGDIGDFGPDGLARVSTTHNWFTGTWGVIDTQGREVVPAVCDTVGLGGDGLIVVGSESAGYTVLDTQGQRMGVLPKEAAGSWGVREGLALYQDKELQLWGYLDLEGRVVIPARFEVAGLFYDGRAAVVLEDKLGYIDPTGKVVIPCRYDPIDHYSERHFQDGAAIVTDPDGLELVIDRDGAQLSPRKYHRLDDGFSPNGLAFYQYIDEAAQAFGEGFLDVRGVEHPLPEYENSYQFMGFSGEYYLVYWPPGGGYNYMDTQGNILFPQWFAEASPLTGEGRAIVRDERGEYCRLELKK